VTVVSTRPASLEAILKEWLASAGLVLEGRALTAQLRVSSRGEIMGIKLTGLSVRDWQLESVMAVNRAPPLTTVGEKDSPISLFER
jgi:hypothetical protein